MGQVLVVGFGGFCGAIARYTVSGWVHRIIPGSFPSGTLVVNIVGCLLIGTVMHLVESHHWLTAHQRLMVITGGLGALTTFSTFGYETLQLVRTGAMGWAIASVLANCLLGLGAVWLGQALLQYLGW